MNTLPIFDTKTQTTRQDERQDLIAFALTARTPADIVQATQMLDDWLRRYPEDHSIADAYEVLALRQSAPTL
jgi:hypothetical protein